MRRTLPIAFAASLTLGAAPPPGSEVAECRVSYGEAIAELDHLPVRRRVNRPSEDAYSATRQFNPVRITAFGFPVRAFSGEEVTAISHYSLTLTTVLEAPYAPVRAAALASPGKAECADRDGPPGYCVIDERHAAGWTIAFILEDRDGRPTVTCLYTRPSS